MADTDLFADLPYNAFAPFSEPPSTTPPTKGPPTTTPRMGPPTASAKRSSNIQSTKGPHTTPTTKGPPTTPHNVHASTPYWSWSSIQRIPPARPSSYSPSTHSPLHLTTPLTQWKPSNVASDIDWFPKYNYKFVFVDATPPPMRRGIHTGALVLRIIGGAVGFFFALLIISNLKNRKQRSRREIVLVTDVGAVEQNLQPEWRPPFESGEPGPLNNEMPPSYQECTLYSVTKEVGEGPPPYTAPEYHKQGLDGFIDNERRACSGDMAPGTRTELVFDSGRVVERLSLDASSDGNKTREADDDADKQNTTHADSADRVVYTSVNETANK